MRSSGRAARSGASRAGAAGSGQRRRFAPAGLALTVLLGFVAGCDNGPRPDRPAPAREGGTLRVSVATRPVHLDPQRVRTPTEASVSRLITRTLTTFRSDAGPATGAVGDLATDAGRPSENNQLWEYTLKPGVKWEDGSPVSCADVKYGVERSFSGLLAVVQPYPREYLQDNNPPYAGPYVGGNNGGKGLESVQCADSRTVRFRLKYPVADFSSMVATTAFAPVPAKRDNKQDYDKRPYSDGPYRVEKNDDQALVLARNPTWAKDTDPARRAYPDRVVVTANPDVASVSSAVVGGDGDWANTVMLDQDIAPAFLQQVLNDPALGTQVISNVTTNIRYFAINTRRITSVDCRKALGYAFNKRRFLDALGGSLLGDYATTMISSQIKGYRSFDPYGTNDNPNGNPDAAKKLLDGASNAGRACDTTIKVAFPDREDVKRPVATMVEPYQAVGIRIELRPINPATYWDVVGNPANDNDLIYAEWVPPWPGGAAVIPPLFDSRLIPTEPDVTANGNLSLLNDTEITNGIAAALVQPTPDAQDPLWGDLDQKIQAKAATIPIVFARAVRLVGSNVRGGYIHPGYGQPDLATIGLAETPKAPSSIPPGGASYPSGAAASGAG